MGEAAKPNHSLVSVPRNDLATMDTVAQCNKRRAIPTRPWRVRKRTRLNREKRAARMPSDSDASPIALLPPELVDALLYWLDAYSLVRCLRASPLFWRRASVRTHFRAHCELGGRELAWRGPDLTTALYFLMRNTDFSSWLPDDLARLGAWCDYDTVERMLATTAANDDNLLRAFLRGALTNPDAAVVAYALRSINSDLALEEPQIYGEWPNLDYAQAAIASLGEPLHKKHTRKLNNAALGFALLSSLGAGAQDLIHIGGRDVGVVYRSALGVADGRTLICDLELVAAIDETALWLVLLAACVGGRVDLARFIWDTWHDSLAASCPTFRNVASKSQLQVCVRDAKRCYDAHGNASPYAALFCALPGRTIVNALVAYAIGRSRVDYGDCAVEAIEWVARRGQYDTLWWLLDITGLAGHWRALEAIFIAIGTYDRRDVLASLETHRWPLVCQAVARGLAEATSAGSVDLVAWIVSTCRVIHHGIPYGAHPISRQTGAMGRMILPECRCCHNVMPRLYKAATRNVNAAAFWLAPEGGGFNAAERDELLCESLKRGRLDVVHLCIGADIAPPIDLDRIATKLHIEDAWRLGTQRLNPHALAKLEGTCAVKFSRLAQAKLCLMDVPLSPRFIDQLYALAFKNNSRCLTWLRELRQAHTPNPGVLVH